jgi:hypothetical protein
MPYFIGGFFFAILVIAALDEDRKDKSKQEG